VTAAPSDSSSRSSSRPSADALARLARFSGPLGAVLTVGAILAAIALSPDFSWTGGALSDLGVAADPLVRLLFNGGLIGGAVVAVAFGRALRRDSTAVAAGYVLAIVAMALVGVFPAGTPLHFPVAVAFFLLATATVTLDGWRRRGTLPGRVALALAAGHVLGWLLWGAGVRPGPGLALPEVGGVAMFGLWVVALAPPIARR